MKKLAIGLLTMLSAVVLAGCGNADASEGGYVEEIQSRGALRIALSADYPPFEFQILEDGRNVIVGADVDLANEIAAELGVELEIMNMNFNSVLNSLASGQADMAISALSATAERREVFDFSDIYYMPANKVLVQADRVGEFDSISDFDGKTIGVLQGSVQEGAVDEQLPNARRVSLQTVNNLINELLSGQIDGVMIEGTIGQAYIYTHGTLAFSTVEFETNEDSGYAIAMNQGTYDLQEVVNAVIARLQAEGEIDRMVERNFLLAMERGQAE